MSKKFSASLAVLLVVALLVTACAAPVAAPAAAPAAGDQAAAPASKGEIVFIPKSTSATFYLFLVKGAQDKAKELGYTVDYQGPATEADIAAQVDLVRNITKKKPAGILLAALDSQALIPPIEEAMAAGVPVAMADSGVDGDAPLASIITDQYKGGFMAGEEMAKLLDKKGLVANLGIQAGSVSAGRSTGFAEAIAQYPGHAGVGDPVDGRRRGQVPEHRHRPDHGQPGDRRLLLGCCAHRRGHRPGGQGQGDRQEPEDHHLRPQPGDPAALRGWHDQAIIAQDPYQMGYQGVAAIDAFINGQKIENPKIELAPVLITPDNYKSAEVQALLQTPDKFQK